MKGMLLAAGLGTRLKPWTDHHPKALALILGKSLLQRNIEYLQRFNIRDVVVNVHHFADQVIDMVKNCDGWGSSITISNESSEVLETGGGLMKAAPLLEDSAPFVLMNADILTDLELDKMIQYHFNHWPLATLATTTRETSRYFIFDNKNELAGWKNMKTGEEKSKRLLNSGDRQEAFSGIHIINPEIFSLILQKGKFSMVDVYLSLMNDHSIKSFDHSDGVFIDVGKPESLIKAERLFSGRL